MYILGVHLERQKAKQNMGLGFRMVYPWLGLGGGLGDRKWIRIGSGVVEVWTFS